MNIFDYFHSEDIAEHCKKINHSFSPLDMAVIVHLSEKPMRQKHEAYRHIMGEYPDMPIRQSPHFEERDSLHQYLRELMAYETRAIEKIVMAETGAVFWARVWHCGNTGGQPDVRDVDGCFSSFEKAKEAVDEQWDWNQDKVLSAVIHEATIDGARQNRYVEINENGDITGLSYYGEGAPDSLDMIYFHLPLPFQKGDLVTFGDGGPYVLKWLPHWLDDGKRKYEDYLTGKLGDGCDMCATVFCMREGEVSSDNGPPYMTWKLRYYGGEWKGQDRFLKHLGKYLKEKGDGLDWLLAVYMKYYTRVQNERWSSLFGGWFPPLEEDQVP